MCDVRVPLALLPPVLRPCSLRVRVERILIMCALHF